jgi:DtxR family Mn-dependent transcriptional regulator
MKDQLSHNIQDYLKHIFEITRHGGCASNSQLAEMLGISAASVTNMLQKLSQTQPPYVTYTKHKGAKLTEAGRLVALKMIRRHRLIEHFLVMQLGYTWDEVHEEAEVLEHAMSPLLEQRMDAALGFPKFDPHGDPIPDASLKMPEVDQITLNYMVVGQKGKILRVPNEDPQVLRYLAKFGLHPGSEIEFLDRTPYDQTMRIKINNEEIIIGSELGGKISISIIK